MRTFFRFLGVSMLICTTSAVAQPAALAPLLALSGQTFHGVPQHANARAEELSRWEVILGGSMLRITHAYGDGSFGGETLIYWDKQHDGLRSVFVSTDGYRAEGSFTVLADGDWRAEQEVTGDPAITLGNKVKGLGTARLGCS